MCAILGPAGFVSEKTITSIDLLVLMRFLLTYDCFQVSWPEFSLRCVID